MCVVVNKDIQKMIRLEHSTFPPRSPQKGTGHQIFNFKTAAKSETSSRTQTQLGLDDLEISPQMGTRTQERDK